MSTCFIDWVKHCERSVLVSLGSKNKSAHVSESIGRVREVRRCRRRLTRAEGYLSSGRLSHCLAVIPGNDEKERDDSRDWSSDVASDLSMAVKTHVGVCEESQDVNPAPSNHRKKDRSVKFNLPLQINSANTLLFFFTTSPGRDGHKRLA